MSHPDRMSDNYRSAPTLNKVRPSLGIDPDVILPGHNGPDRYPTIGASDVVDQMIRLTTDILFGPIPDPSLRASVDEDAELAQRITDRPRWACRSPSDKQTPLEFFFAHYPDAAQIQLTWVALRRHDPSLYSGLQVHRSRNKLDDIPLLTKSQAIIARVAAKRCAGVPVSLDEAERLARFFKRKKLKLSPSRV